jgi:hypothetical protein
MADIHNERYQAPWQVDFLSHDVIVLSAVLYLTDLDMKFLKEMKDIYKGWHWFVYVHQYAHAKGWTTKDLPNLENVKTLDTSDEDIKHMVNAYETISGWVYMDKCDCDEIDEIDGTSERYDEEYSASGPMLKFGVLMQDIRAFASKRGWCPENDSLEHLQKVLDFLQYHATEFVKIHYEQRK